MTRYDTLMAPQDELLTRHHEALQRLSRTRFLKGRAAALSEACVVAAEVLDVARVSIWLYGKGRTSIRCETLFERDEGRHSTGLELFANDFPAYFRALDAERTIAAADAHTDPQTAEFSEIYLTPLGIGALLDAPILIMGECVGVVCNEHIGGPREWLVTEQLLAGSIADFTALAIQAEQLQDQRRDLQEALDAAGMGVWSWDVSSDQLHWSEPVGHLLDLPSSGSPSDYKGYLELSHPDDREAMVKKATTALETSAQGFLVQHRLVLATGEVRWMEVRAGIDRNETGKLIGVHGTVMDITERHVLEEQLLQAQKMEAVGRLAGGVAHDFNNLLTAISGAADMVCMKLSGSSELLPDVTHILDAAERGGALTQQLLTFARKQQNRPSAVDVNELVRGLDDLLRRLIGESVQIEIALADEPLVTTIDPGQLEQVLVNLAINARDAMPTGGTLWLSTGHTGSGSDRMVRIKVTDTGVGMSEETMQRAFEPFFTSKDRGQGTGLGLSTCYGIVDQAGGTVNIQSKLDEGSTFIVLLPEIEAKPEAITRRQRQGRPHPGTESILLVEDEPLVRNLAERALRLHGYRVLCASDPIQASQIARSHGSPFDLLVTDMIMPNGSGTALAEALRAEGIVHKALLISGYSFEDPTVKLPPNTYFLPKPFTGRTLADYVREVLDTDDLDSSQRS